jgi:Ca-activated chloride channel family protein
MPNPASITFLWPSLLWLLLLLPVVLAIYFGVLIRRRRAGGAYANLELAEGSGSAPRAALRYLPALLWFGALAALILAIARPQAALTLPARIETIVLALDTSGSMRATDLTPNRMVAARAAAKSFVEAQPQHVRVGVVAIAAAAAVVQSPTNKREDILQAIERLEPQRGTALGNGLVIALDTALPQAGINVEQFINPRTPRSPGGTALGSKGPAGKESNSTTSPAPERVAPGANTATAIVLLSDGQNNVGQDPLKAAEIAADYGVRIYTVGIGTAEGTIVKSDGWSMRTRLDEESLKKIAALTEGEYFQAANAADLTKIYRTLSARLSFEKQRPTEITAVLVAFGALLATAAALLSMWWFNRIL